MKSKIISLSLLFLTILPFSATIFQAQENLNNELTEDDETITEEDSSDKVEKTDSSDKETEEEKAKKAKELEEKNKKLQEENEKLEKEKKITDNAKKELEENKDEVESLQKELVNVNKECLIMEDNLDSLSKETSKILKLMQRLNNKNSVLILYNQLLDAKTLEEFLIRAQALSIIFEEMNQMITEFNQSLLIIQNKKSEIISKTLHLELVSQKLQKEIDKYTKDIEFTVNPLQSASTTYFKTECETTEIYGINCGKELPEAQEFVFPITTGSVTNEYGGWDALNQSDGHTGIDMIGDENIHPIAPGEVEEVTVDAYGGIQVMMIHNIKGKNYISNYAHLSKVNVIPGDILTTDDTLGVMGDTGVATGVHLHLEIIEGPYYIHSQLENPRNYLDFPPLYVEFTKKKEKND